MRSTEWSANGGRDKCRATAVDVSKPLTESHGKGGGGGTAPQ